MTKSFGFLVETVNVYGTDKVQARVMVRESDRQSPLNPGSDPFYHWHEGCPKALEGLLFDGLRLECWYSDMGTVVLVGGTTPEYMDVYSIDERKAVAMAKTLKRVNRAIQKAEANEPGDAFVAMAKALGLTFAVTRVKNDRNGSSYEDSDWFFSSIEYGRNVLRRMIVDIHPHKDEAAA